MAFWLLKYKTSWVTWKVQRWNNRFNIHWICQSVLWFKISAKSFSWFLQFIVGHSYEIRNRIWPQILARMLLYSSPCPRRPPPPLILSVVALGGGVGERGQPGAHQAGHHLPVVVVVASWNTGKKYRAIVGKKYRLLCICSCHASRCGSPYSQKLPNHLTHQFEE